MAKEKDMFYILMHYYLAVDLIWLKFNDKSKNKLLMHNCNAGVFSSKDVGRAVLQTLMLRRYTGSYHKSALLAIFSSNAHNSCGVRLLQ